MRLGRMISTGLTVGLVAALGREAFWAVRAVGSRPNSGQARPRSDSPLWHNGAFHNGDSSASGAIGGSLFDLWRRMREFRHERKPTAPIPLVTTRDDSPGVGLSLTWFGHASVMVELEGLRLLCDPIWSERCSPSRIVGPKRLHPPPVPLAELGRIDAVVISHDHYDHLDYATITWLSDASDASFVVPLGVGSQLRSWGVPASRITELQWDESMVLGPLKLTCVESQHFSGRALRRDQTLWSSWIIEGSSNRVFFSGDTGYFAGYERLGDKYGPFDAALMAVGAYDPAWASIHLTPEEAVLAATQLGAKVMIPIHWATFVLAPHPWAEPVERALRAAANADLTLTVPRVGERVTLGDVLPTTAWWMPRS